MQNGETANLMGLLIADEDLESRKRMAALFIEAGYQITVTNSAAYAMYGILKNVTQVVLLSHHFDEQPAVNLIPLLKQCNNDLTIILVGDEKSSLSTQKTRHEGVFYHALRPTRPEDGEELRQAVKCAFEQLICRKKKSHLC
jgi:DNA-binding NtrC family response regulator